MKITVDEDRCCGAGQCVLLAPDVFDQRDEDGIVKLLTAEPPTGTEGAVTEAAVVCPTGAIRVDDA
ncbi:ferredoxin [Stackebrandtia soli]|uniref:ferredoxin n=1 Tax=Stackebrandtia soli TaxID=1892856 RepID=UPI0039ECED8E